MGTKRQQSRYGTLVQGGLMRHFYILLIATIALMLAGSPFVRGSFVENAFQNLYSDSQGFSIASNGFGPVTIPNG
jgi:hypothetical protein